MVARLNQQIVGRVAHQLQAREAESKNTRATPCAHAAVSGCQAVESVGAGTAPRVALRSTLKPPRLCCPYFMRSLPPAMSGSG